MPLPQVRGQISTEEILLYRSNQHLSCDAVFMEEVGYETPVSTPFLEKMLARQCHSNKCPSHLRKFAQHLPALLVIKISIDNG